MSACLCVFPRVCPRQQDKEKKDKAREESEGVRLWEAEGEKLSVSSHIKVTQS